jgi:hypothetical protein
MPEALDLDRQLRLTKVLVGALMLGLVSLTGTFSVLMQSSGKASPGLSQMPMLGVLGMVWLSSAGMSFFIPAMITNALKRQFTGAPPDVAMRALMPKYRVIAILRGALLEGPGLFGAVAAFLTGAWGAFAAPALSLLVLLVTFPSVKGFLRFADTVTGTPNGPGGGHA